MRVRSLLLILAGFIVSNLSAAPGQSTNQQTGARAAQTQTALGANAIVDSYCAGCHNGSMQSPSGVLLDQFDAGRIADSPEVWSRAYRQIQAGTMPPVGAPRPDRAGYDALLVYIDESLGATASPPSNATSQEIAESLATLLWDSTPDASLRQDAEDNRLGEPATLDTQIHRMLADDRAEAFVGNFFIPWLELDRLDNTEPDTTLFPDFDISLRDSLLRETQLFLLSQLRDDRDPVELWRANYTFLNEQLARHYGIGNVTGSEFRRVSLSLAERSGLLGHGSVLMVTSRHQQGADAAYTSPATRAKWVQSHFLGAPTPRPFPGAQPVSPELPITPQTRTLPTNPCVTCHQNFFPLGYALENFDPIGRWRANDQAGAVDASGRFVDGSTTNGVVELRDVLLERPEAFRTTITERLVAYAAYSSTGEMGTFQASPETLLRARQILLNEADITWSGLIAAIVRTRPLAIE